MRGFIYPRLNFTDIKNYEIWLNFWPQLPLTHSSCFRNGKTYWKSETSNIICSRACDGMGIKYNTAHSLLKTAHAVAMYVDGLETETVWLLSSVYCHLMNCPRCTDLTCETMMTILGNLAESTITDVKLIFTQHCSSCTRTWQQPASAVFQSRWGQRITVAAY